MEHDIKRPMGFVETVRMRVEEFFVNMNITSSDVIRFASCFAVGFIVGLILKRYAKYIIMFITVSVLFLAILHYAEFIMINHDRIKSLLGLQGTETFDSIVNLLLAFVRLHIVEIGSGILGCLLGFKVG